jgi:hypothetical protein
MLTPSQAAKLRERAARDVGFMARLGARVQLLGFIVNELHIRNPQSHASIQDVPAECLMVCRAGSSLQFHHLIGFFQVGSVELGLGHSVRMELMAALSKLKRSKNGSTISVAR